MGTLAPVIKHQFLDNNGDPLSGGKLYTYAAGTTTPLGTFSDEALSVPNTNPIILDSAGRCDLWLAAGNFKFVMETSADVELWTRDNVLEGGGAAGSSAADKYTKSHTDFQTAAVTNSITAFSLPAKTMARWFIFKHSTIFAGSGITSYTISVGITGDLTLFVDNFNVMATVDPGTFELVDSKYLGSFSTAKDIILTATANVNLSNSTGGAIELHVDEKALS